MIRFEDTFEDDLTDVDTSTLNLLIRPMMSPLEDWFGYLRRLHAANFFPHYQAIFPELDNDSRLRSFRQRSVWQKTLLLLPSERLALRFGEYFVADLTADSRGPQTLKESRAVCPQCIEKTGVVHRLWRYDWGSVCLTHGCGLIVQCPECRHLLQWSDKNWKECGQCGVNLGTCQAKKVRPEALYIYHHLLSDSYDALPAPTRICYLASPLRLASELNTLALTVTATVDLFEASPSIEPSFEHWSDSTSRLQRCFLGLYNCLSNWSNSAKCFLRIRPFLRTKSWSGIFGYEETTPRHGYGAQLTRASPFFFTEAAPFFITMLNDDHTVFQPSVHSPLSSKSREKKKWFERGADALHALIERRSPSDDTI